jgi:hypothetical protein
MIMVKIGIRCVCGAVKKCRVNRLINYIRKNLMDSIHISVAKVKY